MSQTVQMVRAQSGAIMLKKIITKAVMKRRSTIDYGQCASVFIRSYCK